MLGGSPGRQFVPIPRGAPWSPARERQALYLKGLGYSYDEIGQLTGSTYTAVSRRITEGRRGLRRRSDALDG